MLAVLTVLTVFAPIASSGLFGHEGHLHRVMGTVAVVDLAAGLAQHVAPAVHRVDQFGLEVLVDLAAQVVDVDLDEVRGTAVVEIPGVVEDHLAGDQSALVSQQVLEHREFLG
jgi:hypothetical protein